MIVSKIKSDSRQLDESDYRSKTGDNVLRLWNGTLQILLPVAALAVIWGRRGLLTRFLLQFEKNCISVICPSIKDKQHLVNWINYYVSSKWFYHNDTTVNTPIDFWKNGSLLCTLINTAIPGACSNPERHWNRPPSHGLALAYKYLGIAPVFTERDFSVKDLTEKQKTILENYIRELREAVTKASSHDYKFSSAYIAKGMGLVSGEQFRKMCFYIYLNAPTALNCGDIVINIRAPHNTYQTLSIPSYNIRRKISKNCLTAKRNKTSRFLRSLSIDLGRFINNEMKEEVVDKIPTTFAVENERIKIMYIPQYSGIYEISIITNGFHLLGSPFPVSILENTSKVIENLSDNDENINIKKVVSKKVVSEVIDFVDHPIIKDRSIIKTNNLTDSIITEEDEFSDKSLDSDTEGNSFISSICTDHIETEISKELKPFLALEKNQEKGITDYLLQSNGTTIFDELRAKKELQLKPDNISTITENDLTKSYPLNILNYLTHLKLNGKMHGTENPIVAFYKDFWQSRLISDSSHSLSNYDIQSDKGFEDKLKFWISQSSLDLSDKPRLLKRRSSLPNLHAVIPNYNNSTADLVWKKDYVAKRCVKTVHNEHSHSLPNIHESIHSCDSVQVRIEEYMEGFEFRDKFKRCLNYWEKMSSNCSSIDNLSLRDFSEEGDSGLGHSLTSSTSYCHNEYLRSLLADAYKNLNFKEILNYWEELTSSAKDVNKISKRNVVKRNHGELLKTKEVLLGTVKKLNQANQERIRFEDHLENNLVDDFKSMQTFRERMRTKFNKNKEFFKSLESIAR